MSGEGQSRNRSESERQSERADAGAQAESAGPLPSSSSSSSQHPPPPPLPPSSPSYSLVMLGPPGSGKTSLCYALTSYLSRIGRTVTMVNLDPGNLSFSKDSVGLGDDEVDSVDVYDVRSALNIRLEEVQRRKKLGPNGAMVDCVESLAKDLPKLLSDLVSISRSKPPQHHFVFDVCGQVELYTH